MLLLQFSHAGDGVIGELQQRAEFDGRRGSGMRRVCAGGWEDGQVSAGEGAAGRFLRVRHPCLFPRVL